MTSLFPFAVNVNEQRIITFLTEKCCYLNLRSKVRTQLRWCGKFYCSRMQNFCMIKMIWNYKNRIRLAKVIVKNKMSHFLWFTVYSRWQTTHMVGPWTVEFLFPNNVCALVTAYIHHIDTTDIFASFRNSSKHASIMLWTNFHTRTAVLHLIQYRSRSEWRMCRIGMMWLLCWACNIKQIILFASLMSDKVSTLIRCPKNSSRWAAQSSASRCNFSKFWNSKRVKGYITTSTTSTDKYKNMLKLLPQRRITCT